jgi:hypothetical protein
MLVINRLLARKVEYVGDGDSISHTCCIAEFTLETGLHTKRGIKEEKNVNNNQKTSYSSK